MPGCCIRMPENMPAICENWDPSERRNFIASVFSGCLFFIGWWFVIDAAAMYPDNNTFTHAYHVCGVVATLAMLMVNSVSNGQIRGDMYTDGCIGPFGARIWLFLGLMLSFGSIIAACWILFAGYVIPKFNILWPGVAVFLQNLFIFFSSIIYKIGRSEDNWGRVNLYLREIEAKRLRIIQDIIFLLIFLFFLYYLQMGFLSNVSV